MGTHLTVKSQVAPAIEAYLSKIGLMVAKENIVLNQFGESAVIPRGVGGSYRWYRYLKLAKATTPVTEDSVDFPHTNLYTQEIVAQPVHYRSVAKLSARTVLTGVDQEMEGATEVMAAQKAETMDWLANAAVATGVLRRRVDGDASYQIDGVTTNAGTTTTVVDATRLNQADGFWVGGYVTITDPTSPAYGETRKITASAQSTGTLTVDAPFFAAPGSGKKYRVVIGTSISSSNPLSTAAILRALTDLRVSAAPTYSDGYYRLVVTPYLAADLMRDDTFVQAASYRNDVESLLNGEIGRWLKFRVVEETTGWREDADGTANENGAVHVALALGKGAFGNVEISGLPQQVLYRNWRELGQPAPGYDTLSWTIMYDCHPLNSCFGVALLSGVTA